METYLYFDINQDTRAFHFMGNPDETKHLIIANEQTVISPSWSIQIKVESQKIVKNQFILLVSNIKVNTTTSKDICDKNRKFSLKMLQLKK
jgi:5-keto 4-deoxyuronate isomerase